MHTLNRMTQCQPRRDEWVQPCFTPLHNWWRHEKIYKTSSCTYWQSFSLFLFKLCFQWCISTTLSVWIPLLTQCWFKLVEVGQIGIKNQSQLVVLIGNFGYKGLVTRSHTGSLTLVVLTHLIYFDWSDDLEWLSRNGRNFLLVT